MQSSDSICKNYTILGFGKTARAVVDYLLNQDHKVFVSDEKPREKFDQELIKSYETKGVRFVFNKLSLAEASSENMTVIISPGIPPSSPIIQEIKSNKINHRTDLDLFIETLTKEEQYIAITGTNGKTTTTSLVAHIFDTQGIGNIGKPFLEFSDLSSPYVCEISSFQIFHSELKRLPDIAIHLNLTDDHLDWHSSLDEYKETKERLFGNSEEERFSVLNFDDEVTRNLGERLLKSRTEGMKSKVLYFSTTKVLDELSSASPVSAYLRDSRICLGVYLGSEGELDPQLEGIVIANSFGEYFLEIPLVKTGELKILGDHNYSNALAATLAAFAYGKKPEEIIEKLLSFNAVPHRLEYVTEFSGHKFYNDSKATNPDSAIKALNAFDKSIAIIGGKNKNLDLTAFLGVAMEKCHGIVLIGELKQEIANYLEQNSFENFKLSASLEDAVNHSLELAKGTYYPIILSPASSSFDMFINYEDRGEQFKKLVKSLVLAS
jgi:UDP-N-acetylmuramoylalanine--D-glutamate ligase